MLRYNTAAAPCIPLFVSALPIGVGYPNFFGIYVIRDKKERTFSHGSQLHSTAVEREQKREEKGSSRRQGLVGANRNVWNCPLLPMAFS